jgi:hypothetical protein
VVVSSILLCGFIVYSVFVVIIFVDLFRFLTLSYVSKRVFHGYIGRVNKELNFLRFEAQVGKNQYGGEIYYGVVNKVVDERANLGTQCSLLKIAFSRAPIT